jgi:hypothetical protein
MKYLYSFVASLFTTIATTTFSCSALHATYALLLLLLLLLLLPLLYTHYCYSCTSFMMLFLAVFW